MTITATRSRALTPSPRTYDMLCVLEDLQAASARLCDEYIRPVQVAPVPPPAAAPTPPPGADFATQAVGTLVGTVTVLAVAAHRVLLGGCAGIVSCQVV